MQNKTNKINKIIEVGVACPLLIWMHFDRNSERADTDDRIQTCRHCKLISESRRDTVTLLARRTDIETYSRVQIDRQRETDKTIRIRRADRTFLRVSKR